MKSSFVVCVLALALTLPGCSSRPRDFAPRLAAPPVSATEFDATYAECSQLLVAGKLDRNGRLGSGAAGAAAGGALAVAGGAAASSAGLYAGAAVASATIVLIPFVALGGAFGMAKMKRAKKENAIKAAMAGCLKERGHEVARWEKVDKKARRARAKAVPVASR